MIKLDENNHGITVVIPTNHREIPGSIPRKYDFQIKITSSLRMKHVRHGIHQVCPGVVNSLGTLRSTEHPDHICTTIQSDGVTQGVNRSVRPSRVMEPFKEWKDQWGQQRRPSVGKKSKMPHEILLRDSESPVRRRFWCNLNLKIISPRNRTRDFTVVGRNYRYAVNDFIKLDESLRGVTVFIPTNGSEIPGSIPGRYNLQIKITSTSWILADEVCAAWYSSSLPRSSQ